MRPLTRPPWEPRFQGASPALLAQHAFGGYCAACERRLPEGGVAWNAATGAALERGVAPLDWGELLVLCPNCALAATSGPPTLPERLLLPDRDETFALAGPSPLSYELRRLRIRRAGAAVAEVERALAVARSERAAQTVRRFALNTPFHGPEEALTLPEGTELGLLDAFDPRLERRTEAWVGAEESARRLAQSRSSTDRRLLAEAVAYTIEFQGFWSVWATVLWKRLRDPELLAELLLQDSFPSTRAEWLPAIEGT